MKEKCKKCGKGYRKLTREGLCAICFKDVHGKWSSDFTGGEEPGPMKFRKSKRKKKKK